MKFKLLLAPFLTISSNLAYVSYVCQIIHCPTASFGPLLRGSVTDPILITVFDSYLTLRSPGSVAKILPILNVAL